jgi:8-oxo-dGTP diphosphatase
MPHIHNEPDQHDMTVSGYIVRVDANEPLCLVHMHKKIGKLMQIGGHIELNETPWAAIAHELEEESGYQLGELKVVQYTADRVVDASNISHPTPFLMNTHNVGNEHYHSDLCFGFVANGTPAQNMADGESADLRWLTLSELREAAKNGEALQDVSNMYTFLVEHLNSYAQVLAADFSVDKPRTASATYKHGAPGK